MGMGSVIARPVTGSGIVRPVAAPFDEPSHNNTEDEKEREKHARERLRKEEEEEKARMDEEVKKELERMERELEGHRQQQDQERLRKQAEKLERDTKREVEARERERKELEEEECKAKEQQQQEEQRRKEEEEAKQRQALKSEKELELESRRLEDERLHKERLQREEKARLWRLREENKAAVKIQARWKASHEKRKFQVMRKMNLYRTQVAQEILSTEENYVKTLREVVEHFVRPLKEAVARGKPIISNDEIKTIFSHIQIILGYNDALLEDLRKKTSSWHPYQMIGDVFLKMAAFMRVYTDYVRNFNDALAMIQECKKSPEFLAFCNDTYPKMSVVQADLSSYLITPVQRIPRYQLLVRDLLKHTWKEHSDYDNLEQALQQITTTAIYVNDKQKEAENIQKMLNIQGSLYGKKLVNLVDPQRRFIREGSLVEINPKGKGKPRWFFLFTDLLVKCNMSNTMKKKTFKKGSGAPTFEYVEQIPLEGCELVNTADEGDKKHSFQVVSSPPGLWLCASAEEEKTEWIKDLKECIKLLKEKSDLYDEHATKIASQRAAAAKALISEQYTGYRVRGSYTSASGAKRAEARKGSLGGNNPMELPDEDTDLGKSSFRSLSAQERFQLAKQAEQRLGLLLEEEKLQEQNRLEAGYERVRQFKDSMGKRYSNASEDMSSMDGSDCDETLDSSDSSFISDLNEGINTEATSGRTSRVGSFEESEGSLNDSGSTFIQPGKRRFASMKREHFRGAGGSSSPKSNSLPASPKEDREEAPLAGSATKLNTDAPAAGAPKTRKFASLKREDYRSARASRYTSSGPSSIGSSGTDLSAMTDDATLDKEESDVVIHEDAAPTPLAAVLEKERRKTKTNYATGRQRYPSVHSKDLPAGGDFGDVADMLTELKKGKADSSLGNSSTMAGAAASVAAGGDESKKKIKKKKKFSSLRPLEKKSSAALVDGSKEEFEEPVKKYSSMKRDDFKAHSAAFGAIELKDMVAVARPATDRDPIPSSTPNGGGAPKRRFASMKRENYKNFKQLSADSEREFDDAADDAKQ